jgi:hypothetical protein
MACNLLRMGEFILFDHTGSRSNRGTMYGKGFSRHSVPVHCPPLAAHVLSITVQMLPLP